MTQAVIARSMARPSADVAIQASVNTRSMDRHELLPGDDGRLGIWCS